MKLIAPNYYKSFHCIADQCRHSCCIGWEIDINEDSLEYYRNIGGAFGKKLLRHIETDGDTAHFRLVGEEDRCPFLKANGLCEMILTLGEDSLCEICREHPRFYLSFSDRDEVGFGLCCEEAARLILSQTDDTTMEVIEDDGNEEDTSKWEQILTHKRHAMFDLLQNRSQSLEKRIRTFLDTYNVCFPQKSPDEWCDILISLEVLDPSWHTALKTIRGVHTETGTVPEMPFEKLLLYFLYRHTAEAQNEKELGARIAFSYLGYHIVRLLCTAKYQQSGSLTTDDIIDFARRYSSEIEYSIENTDDLIELFLS